MKSPNYHITTANKAVAEIAYKTNEVFPIYPITPASEMAELVETYSAQKKPNIYGNIPKVIQMQSEAGVAGTMHGAIQTGSLSSTFTASQGLLLMLPNMYKIAGELTPNVIHVATRTIATHALSIFGDHSDIMAARQSGYAFLGSASVQEAQDFALIAQVASINSNLPFVHFFDGFRTSHETAKIESIQDEVISSLMNSNNINAFRKRALNPNNPVIRGTAQGPDEFFQNREASNTFYKNCPNIVQETMDRFASLTGRQYQLFEYIGDPKAEHVFVAMASSVDTIATTISQLNEQGERLGLVKVRLFRPFSSDYFLTALPDSAKTITVLDRTKEAGSIAEPLCLDISQTILNRSKNDQSKRIPTIIGGRYGLSSKEFTPAMVRSIIRNAKEDQPKSPFTIGILDDITNLSLNYEFDHNDAFDGQEIIYYQDGIKKHEKSLNEFMNLLGSKYFTQAYTQRNYQKSNVINCCHLRVSKSSIKAPYLIHKANTSIIENLSFLNENAVHNTDTNGRIIVITPLNETKILETIPNTVKEQIARRNICLQAIDPKLIVNKDLHIHLLHLLGLWDLQQFINYHFVVDNSTFIKEIALNPDSMEHDLNPHPFFELSTSMLPPDGTFETNTSILNAPRNTNTLAQWNPDSCVQCGACSMACPLGALRIKAYEKMSLDNAPEAFKWASSLESDWAVDDLAYSIQINPDQCNGCNNCVDVCDENALSLDTRIKIEKVEQLNWRFFKEIPEMDRDKINPTKRSQQQLQEPLFKYALGVDGCGEAPYLKLLSQLYGDRMLIANATGASSIFGGALPTTPWAKNDHGRGPAWSNSLFEDNAEFGLGYRISIDQKKEEAIALLHKLKASLPQGFADEILNAPQATELQIRAQRNRIEALNQLLTDHLSLDAKKLLSLSENLIEKSVWIVGGDGWAYDIGFGGIDHALTSGKNINILVLDNQVYDNTGGQTSKATPFGAKAIFSHNGKRNRKKDLGKYAMIYDDVYVASVSIGANQEQTLRAFNEAESYPGPSIIIAYCHSESHGIDMKNPSRYHKALVNSGAWTLYRRDPRNFNHQLPSFQLDSARPNMSLNEYLGEEERFKHLLEKNNNDKIELIQQEINNRYKELKSIANKELIAMK